MESAIAVVLAGLQVGAIYALVGLSYVVLINATGILNFGQGEWLMVAAMLGLGLITLGTPYWISILLSLMGAVALFLLCERFVIWPLQHRASLADDRHHFATRADDHHSLRNRPDRRPLGTAASGSVRDGCYLVERKRLRAHAFAFHICGAAGNVLWCRGLISPHLARPVAHTSRDRPDRLVGINPDRVRFVAFALAGFISAVVGWVVCSPLCSVFRHRRDAGVKGVHRGCYWRGSPPLGGALAGGVVLGVVETAASRYLPGSFGEATALVILMLIFFLKPSGLVNIKS